MRWRATIHLLTVLALLVMAGPGWWLHHQTSHGHDGAAAHQLLRASLLQAIDEGHDAAGAVQPRLSSCGAGEQRDWDEAGDAPTCAGVPVSDSHPLHSDPLQDCAQCHLMAHGAALPIDVPSFVCLVHHATACRLWVATSGCASHGWLTDLGGRDPPLPFC